MNYVKICDQYVPIEQDILNLLFKYNEQNTLTAVENQLINRFIGYVKSMRCSGCRTKCNTFDIVIDKTVDTLLEPAQSTQILAFPMLKRSNF